MEFRPFFLQEPRVPRDESLRTLRVPIRDGAHDLGNVVRRKMILMIAPAFATWT